MNKKDKMIVIILIVVLLIVLPLLIFINNKKYNMKIYFFDAGKADAIIISINEKYMMIDTGEESLSNEILEYFKKNNITKLDYLVITHFDKDHVGSAANIINEIEVDNVLQSNYPKESEYYNNYIKALNNKEIEPITIEGSYNIELGELKIVVNGTTTKFDNNESNNSSLIVSINYKDKNFLFMGDSQNARIKEFIENNNEAYDFLKVPYHGHYLKRLEDILNSKNIKYAVITSSDKEQEDLETIELLNKYNIKYYLTRRGSITIYSDGKDISIKQ